MNLDRLRDKYPDFFEYIQILIYATLTKLDLDIPERIKLSNELAAEITLFHHLHSKIVK